MLCYLKLHAKENIILPLHYNLALQAMLLKLINEKSYASFIHDVGFQYEKRSYKLYSFSRIMGKAIIDKKKRQFNFGKEVGLYISSMDEKFLQYIFNHFLEDEKSINLLQNHLTIESVEFLPKQAYEPKLKVRTLSPITTYSTLTNSEGKKKTYYYTPYEKEFSENIAKNLVKKYYSYYGTYPEDCNFAIYPKDRVKEVVLTYKGLIIKGWSGNFEITGSEEMMDTAFSAGLGSKNGQGFGLIVGEGVRR